MLIQALSMVFDGKWKTISDCRQNNQTVNNLWETLKWKRYFKIYNCYKKLHTQTLPLY